MYFCPPPLPQHSYATPPKPYSLPRCNSICLAVDVYWHQFECKLKLVSVNVLVFQHKAKSCYVCVYCNPNTLVCSIATLYDNAHSNLYLHTMTKSHMALIAVYSQTSLLRKKKMLNELLLKPCSRTNSSSFRDFVSSTFRAWHFTVATKSIASMPAGRCLGALEMLQQIFYNVRPS